MNLYELMKKHGYSGYSLSKESGISYTTIKDLLNGKRKIENLPGKTINSLAKIFSCSMEEIMNLDTNRNHQDFKSFKTKNDYYAELLRNRKNVILAKDSALEFYRLANDSFSNRACVYSCGDLEEPFDNIKVNNFDDLDYKVYDGVMVTSLSQTVNDIIADDDIDLQPLYEALNTYYFTHDNSFEGIYINPDNEEDFYRIAEESFDYYSEE